MTGDRVPRRTGNSILLVLNPTRADWRALTSAVVIGSGIGLSLGAVYLAGGMSRAAIDHARASRLAETATAGFSNAALDETAAAMDPGVRHVVLAHDPLAGADPHDRQSAVLLARLVSHQITAPTASTIALRAAFGGPYNPPAAPYRLAGALGASRELECLTQAVYFEARGESSAGQAAVAQVVLNRVRNPSYPKSVCGVVFQGAARGVGCQFSFACDGSMRRGREYGAWTRAEEIASRALSGGVMSTVGAATHFHTIQSDPRWGPNLLRVAQVGLHVFYRLSHGVAADRFAVDGQEVAPDAGPPELRLATAVVVEGPSAEAALVNPEAKPAAVKLDSARALPVSPSHVEPLAAGAAS